MQKKKRQDRETERRRGNGAKPRAEYEAQEHQPWAPYGALASQIAQILSN